MAELRVLDARKVAERLQKVLGGVEAVQLFGFGARPEEMNSRADALVEEVVAVFAAALYRREFAALREVLDDLSRVEFDTRTHKAVCGRQLKVRRPRVPTELDRIWHESDRSRLHVEVEPRPQVRHLHSCFCRRICTAREERALVFHPMSQRVFHGLYRSSREETQSFVGRSSIFALLSEPSDERRQRIAERDGRVPGLELAAPPPVPILCHRGDDLGRERPCDVLARDLVFERLVLEERRFQRESNTKREP